MTLHARGGARLPCLRRARACRSSGSGIPGRRPASSRRCRWNSWRRRIWSEPVGYFAPDDLRRARLEHLEDVLVTPGARGLGGCVPALDLHRAGTGRTPRARDRGVAAHPGPVRAGRGLGGPRDRSGWLAGTGSCTSSCTRSTTSSMALPSSARCRYGGTACGIRRTPCAAYRDALALGDTAPAARHLRRGGRAARVRWRAIGELVELVEDRSIGCAPRSRRPPEGLTAAELRRGAVEARFTAANRGRRTAFCASGVRMYSRL